MKQQQLATHLFELDQVGHADHRGDTPCKGCPCKRCPVPMGNRAHDEAAVAKVDEAQAEHLRRIGEDQNQ